MPAHSGRENRHPIVFEFLCQINGFVKCRAVRNQVDDRDSEQDQKVVPDGLARTPHNFDGEPGSGLGIATPLVGSVIGTRSEELVDQIAF